MTQVKNNIIRSILRTAALIAVFCVGVPAFAENITLTSESGGLTLTGRMISYDGEFVQVETAYGPVTLNYASVSCEGVGCPDVEGFVPLVRLSGSERMTNVLIPALIESFARAKGLVATLNVVDTSHVSIILRDSAGNDAARFEIRATNADEGFADLIAHEADVVMSLREVRAQEVERAAEVGLGRLDQPRQSQIIGFDALVPVIGARPGLTAISLNNLARAFAGDITNWKEIGGADIPIALHLNPLSHGQTQHFQDVVLGTFGAEMSGDVTFHADISATSAAVATQDGALSVLPFGDTGNTQPLVLLDSCGLVARPVVNAVKTEDYPLSAPLFLYFPARRQPVLTRDFLAWLRGPQAQLVVRRAGFIDQGAVPISMDAQGQRFAYAIAAAGPEVPLGELQRMVRVLTDRTRLSVSFRFEVGSTRLDAQSRSNLFALGQAIRSGRYARQSLMLVGFSDGRGAASANRDLSSARAEAVKRALIAALGQLPDDVVVETEAFGEALPMGCDDTEWGRQTNRRVELWVAQTSK